MNLISRGESTIKRIYMEVNMEPRLKICFLDTDKRVHQAKQSFVVVIIFYPREKDRKNCEIYLT